ncbi:MAG TPA: type II toxin-antitoxin system RelE/ParE family toxin [Gemmataceae bacterium]|nr:type II toxin-antitoxin system RelE/ParE family toxin [Gemmataceae bacterium]
MPQVLRTSQAEDDLIDILAYVGRRSAAAANRLAAAIDRRCQTLASFPDMGSRCDDLAPGLRCFSVGSYVLFYRPITDGIEVVRVLHSARDFTSIFQP